LAGLLQKDYKGSREVENKAKIEYNEQYE